MDITIDNNKASEIDNVTQASLTNANNTETKHEMDETNNIFGVAGDHHHLNDKLNNLIDRNSIGNAFEEAVSGGGDANNLNMVEKTCLDNDGDMGPETSVDTTDDADIDTDPYECSTLSHSKETLPSDNPFDNKFAPHGFDLDGMQVQDKLASLGSPITDMPFDVHSNEVQMLAQQNVHGFSDFEQHCDDFNRKVDGMGLGEDNVKTDVVTHEISETFTDNFGYHSGRVTDIDMPDDISHEVDSEIIQKSETVNVGCEKPEMPPNRDDLAYNQFEEFIEHPMPMNDEMLKNLGDNLYMPQGEFLVHAPGSFDLKLNGNDQQIPTSFLDTPSSISPAPKSPVTETSPPISPAPVSLAVNANFESFVSTEEKRDPIESNSGMFDIEEESDGFDPQGTDMEDHKYHYGEYQQKQDAGSYGENEKGVDESSDREKYVDESCEHEKYVNKLSEQESHNTDELPSYAQHVEELPQHEKHLDELMECVKQNVEKMNDIEIQNAFGNSADDNEFDEHVSIRNTGIPLFDTVKSKFDAFCEQNVADIVGDEAQVENIETVLVEKGNEPVDEGREINIDDLLQTNLQEEHRSHVHAFDEDLTKETLAESLSKSDHLHESHDEPLPMNENESTTIDDNIFDRQLASHGLDGAKKDKLPSSEQNEMHFETSDILKDDADIKKEDTTQLASKKSEPTINQESCDELLDEWNSTKSQVEVEEKAVAVAVPVTLAATPLENIVESEELLVGIESQQTVELNKKQLEDVRTSDNAVVAKQSEANAESYISDSLDKEVEDMSSRLNPEAKEFVPSSPPVGSLDSKGDLFGSVENLGGDVIIAQSPKKDTSFSMENVKVPSPKDFADEIKTRAGEVDDTRHLPGQIAARAINFLNGDDLIAQSPQKGAAVVNDFILPTLSQFDAEVMNRPSELSVLDAPGSMNLKEAMHEPEKEQISPMELTNSSLEDSTDIMSPVDNIIGKIEDVMNSVQMLPDDDEEDGIKANGTSLPDTNTNGGDMPLVTNLKLEEPKIVAAEVVDMKAKTDKVAKAPEIKKTDVKTKTSSSTVPKKTGSSTSATASDSSKAKAPATVSKTKATAGLAARPRTAPAPSSKTASTEKKPAASVVSARAKPETKSSPVGVKKLPLTKPKTTEENKSAVRQVASKVTSAPRNATTSRTASTTNTTTTAATKRTTTLSATNSTAPKTTAGSKPALSPSTKPTSAATAHKPAISPRSTVASTLRKSETLKSPTSALAKPAPAKAAATATANSTVTKTTSRTSGGSAATTRTITSTTTTVKKSTLSSAPKAAGATTAKKLLAAKKPLASSAAATAAKQKTAGSPIRAPAGFVAATTAAPEIKLNGTSAPAITTNGESKD